MKTNRKWRWQKICAGLVPDDCIIRPRLDDVYDLTADKCAVSPKTPSHASTPHAVAKLDWNNDLQSLVLDLEHQLKKVPMRRDARLWCENCGRSMETVGEVDEIVEHLFHVACDTEQIVVVSET